MKSRPSLKLMWLGLCGATFLICFFLFQGVKNPSWAGQTMGTTYSIVVADRVRPAEITRMKEAVTACLATVNSQMSMWDASSEIARFNAQHESDPFDISPAFAQVVARAFSWSLATGGVLDPTVKPLVDYWGFGPDRDPAEWEAVRSRVGWQKIGLSNGALTKLHPEVQLDLSSIAKGFGVDAVADVIREAGFDDFMVEIGGEVVAEGLNAKGTPWRIGVESPASDSMFNSSIFQVIHLSGEALATSGDYRNFRVRDDGTRYSHIIDPTTGRPAMTDVAGVSVLASCCADADAVATALFVMGSEKGLAWIESHPELEALFLVHAATNSIDAVRSSGFPKDARL